MNTFPNRKPSPIIEDTDKFLVMRRSFVRKNSLIEVSLSNIIKEERVGQVTWQTVALLVVQITPDTVLLLQCIVFATVYAIKTHIEAMKGHP